MDSYVLGLDNGGTVTKAALFDLRGNEIAVVSRQTPVLTPRPGYAERDMDDLWQSNCECISEVLQKSNVDRADIVGLAVTGHGKGLYAWGKDNRPAYKGIVSTDNRAWQYPEKWKNEGTADRLYPRLCQKLIPSQQAALLAWLKDNLPEVYKNIRYAFPVKDYIRFRLTGEAHLEATDISGSGLMNVRDARFDRDLLEALGIGEAFDMLAPLCYSADLCGRVTKEAAQRTGLLEGTPVAGGMFDIDACAIAMNITSPEQLCTITGTWSINEFISKTPILGTQIAMNSLYAIPGYYLLEECSATSAGNLEWFIENCMGKANLGVEANLGPGAVGKNPGKKPYDEINRMVSEVDPAACDVYYLPFLYGSNVHPLAKGSFVGLTSYHTTAHMARAVYEGVVYSAKTHIDRLLSARPAPMAIRMAGGAVNSQVWVQMFADVLGFPIETVKGVKELGAMGCAMAAAVAAGVYFDYTEAAKAMVHVNDPVEPDWEKNRIYKEKYAKYCAVRDALDTVWDRFAV